MSSTAGDPSHAVAPFRLRGDPAEAWTSLRRVLESMKRVRIVAEHDGHLHAEARSLIFRLVDDLDFLLDARQELIHVRSASRVGYSDLGVNRRRVERIRRELSRRGVLAP